MTTILVSCVSDVQVELHDGGDGGHFFAETMSNGNGSKINISSLNVLDNLTLFSIKRNESGEFIENSSVSWSSSGGIGTLTISPDGKSAQFTATASGSGEISIVVDGKKLRTINIDVNISELEISNLTVSSVTSDGFTATIDFSGGTVSSVHTLFYCNRTAAPACDPLMGLSSVMAKTGLNQIVTLSGLINPTDNYAISVVATDSVPVIGSPMSTTQVLDGTAITISNLITTNASLSGFDISADFSGDDEGNGAVNFHYCNETDNPGCNPLLEVPVAMVRGGGVFTYSLGGLLSPNDEADEINIAIVATDPNGTSGSPLSGSEYLADMRLSALVKNQIVSNGFYVEVTVDETDTDGTVLLYYCNDTDSPGCDPLAGLNLPMARSGSKFQVNVSSLVSPNDHGDNINIRVVGSDMDGEVHIGTLTDTFRLTDMEFGDLNIYSITQSGFFVDTLISDSNLDTNANLDAKLFWCNDTVSSGCDPLVSGNVYTTIGGWRSYGFEVTDLVGAPGDEISISVELNDVDGIYITSSTNASSSEILTTNFVIPNPKDIFRSVGPGQTSVLASNGSIGGNITVVGDTATFDNNLLSSNGVGDVIFYGTPGGGGSYDAMAFIHSRTDSKTFTIKTALGATPTATVATSVWKVYRAYTSLSEALLGLENSGIVTDVDLSSFINFDNWTDGRDISAQTGADENWNFALYAGIQADNISAELKTDWIKDKTNTINIFVPKESSHVGISQRHVGKWNSSRYRLVVADATALTTNSNTTTIEGLQIELTGSTNNTFAINSRNNCEGFIKKNIFKSSSTGEGVEGVRHYVYSQRGVQYTTILNNVFYDFSTLNSAGIRVGWQAGGSQSVKIYNNTFYNNYIGFHSNVYRSSEVINNIFLGSIDKDITAETTSGFYRVSYNIFGDSSLDGHSIINAEVGNQRDVPSAGMFFDLPGRHFYPIGVEAIDNGFDLSSEFTGDLNGNPRDANFDIGALEAGGS
jgi:hypothetical protein